MLKVMRCGYVPSQTIKLVIKERNLIKVKKLVGQLAGKDKV